MDTRKEIRNDLAALSFAKYVLNIICASQPLILLINYFTSVYPVEFKETIVLNYLFFVDKIAIVLASAILLSILKKYKSLTLVYICVIAISIGYFELLSSSRPKYMAYIQFLMLFTYSKIVAILTDVRIKVLNIIHYCIYAYQLARLLVSQISDPNFPVPYSAILFIDFICLEFPYNLTLKIFRNTMENQQNLTEDFKTVINLFPNPIVIYNATTHLLTLVNKAAIKSFSNDAKIIDLISCTDIANDLKTKIYMHEGSTFELKAIQLKTSSLCSVLISINDITEITEKEKKIASENAQWLFVNTTNHQIRTPLSGIESSLMLLKNAIADSADKQTTLKHLDIVLLSVIALRHLVDDTVLFCDSKNNNLILNMQSFKIEELSSEIKKLFEFETYSKVIKLQIDEHKTPAYIKCDKVRLFHIIYTLLSNAFKYTISGEIKYTYNLTLQESHAVVEIEVSDTGIGMKKEESNYLFKCFENIEKKKSDANVSSGISLMVVKKLVELMQGKINFSSQYSQGTKFSILLKANFDMDFYQSIPAEHTNINDVSTPILITGVEDYNILIVDDTVMNLFVISSMLKKLGHNCKEAHNGLEAVEMYNKYPYKLIFMDINMPVMNGYNASIQITKIAKEKNASVRIVALSAQDMPIIEDATRKYGISGWVVKPMKIDTLKSILKEQISYKI